jgi:hypothetical protein
MAMKVCDSRIFPLCATHFGVLGCHAEYDLALDGLTRAARRSWAKEMVARMRTLAEGAGWRFLADRIEAP